MAIPGAEVLWTSPNKKWRVSRLRSNDRWVFGVDDGLLTYWPIRYDDGRLAWDNPHAVPEYVREAADTVIPLKGVNYVGSGGGHSRNKRTASRAARRRGVR